LFTIVNQPWDPHPRIAVLNLASGQWRVLAENGADAHYVSGGYLVFLSSGTLMAAPFDLEQQKMRGPPVPVVENVMQALGSSDSVLNTMAGQFSISASGWLTYVAGGTTPGPENTLVWVDRAGAAQPVSSLKGRFEFPSLSPDGKRIAYNSECPYVYDLARGTESQSSDESCGIATWTPDGVRLVMNCSPSSNLYWQLADGSSPAERLTTSKYYQAPGTFTPDGSVLAFMESHSAGSDILAMNMGDRHVTPFLSSHFTQKHPAFSPDGRWLAYTSNESGRYETYVRRFPTADSKWKLSAEGGTDPLWAKNGKELFYRWNDQVWAVEIRTDGRLTPGKPHLLFQKPGYQSFSAARGWDISPDGKRFLMVKLDERTPEPVNQMILVQNWLEELKRLKR
jgi:hypothetical protein